MEGKSIQGSFQIISTGIPLDLSEHFYDYFYVYGNIKYQPSPFIFNINGSKLAQDTLYEFYYDSIDIFILDENSNNLTFHNTFFFFEKEKNYQIIFKIPKPHGNDEVNFFCKLIPSFDYNFEELSFGTKYYTQIDYTFLKICYNNTPKIKFKTDHKKAHFYLASISESNYNIFPKKIEELEFVEVTNFKIVKPKDFDYGILLFFINDKNTTIEFKDGDKSKSKLSTFAIVMITVSCFIFLVIVGLVILFVLRKRRKSGETETKFKSLIKELVQIDE